MKRPITISDMTTKATNSVEENLRSSGKSLAEYFRYVFQEDIETGEPVKSDQEMIYDIMDNSESDRV